MGVASLVLLGVTLLPFDSITGQTVEPLIPACLGLRAVTTHLSSTLRPLSTFLAFLFAYRLGVFKISNAGPSRALSSDKIGTCGQSMNLANALE